MSDEKSEGLGDSSIERDVLEIKSVVKQNNENITTVKNALEKIGLSMIDALGKFKSDFEELKKLLKRLDSIEITLRGLRFTTKDTLEKLIERVLELEKLIKNKPKVDTIVVQEIEEKEAPLTKTMRRKIPKGTANDTATENALNNLKEAIKQQVTAEELVNKIADTRDTLMTWTPHHPVFYEMREWIQAIKYYPKNQPIPPKDANKLLKDINNWLKRLLK
ncbi:MAG: hypothetical protein ACTSQY_06005 [Candidatus Odinarchaeia archaeon]